MPLSRLLPDVAAVPPELAITGLVLDSRSIEPGEAFVAIGGFGTHGLHFVEQAREAGASAILFEPPVPDDVPAPPADALAVPGLRPRTGDRKSVGQGPGGSLRVRLGWPRPLTKK